MVARWLEAADGAMTGLNTSPASIMRWLGVAALHNSQDLKPIKDDDQAMALRRWWDLEEMKKQTSGGDDNAA